MLLTTSSKQFQQLHLPAGKRVRAAPCDSVLFSFRPSFSSWFEHCSCLHIFVAPPLVIVESETAVCRPNKVEASDASVHFPDNIVLRLSIDF
jgi:hypothetical protein